MKSRRRNSLKRRVLAILGEGFEATNGVDMLRLLSEAGFEVYTVLLVESQKWVPLFPVQAFSTIAPGNQEKFLLWASAMGIFDACVIIGLPRHYLQSIRDKSDEAQIFLAALKIAKLSVILVSANEASQPWKALTQAVRPPVFIFGLPSQIGLLHSGIERAFARLINIIHRHSESFHFQYYISEPSTKGQNPGSRPLPPWYFEIEDYLQEVGFNSLPKTNADHFLDNQKPDLLIEFIDSENFKNLDYLHSEAPLTEFSGHSPVTFREESLQTSARLIVCMLSQEVSTASISFLGKPSQYIVLRRHSGDLIVIDQNGERVLPQLALRPALLSLANLLVHRLKINFGRFSEN